MTEGKQVRTSILQALEADLVGPFYSAEEGGTEQEVLALPPSHWYLTGFLAPLGDRETYDATAEDELGAVPDEDDEEADAAEPEPEPKQKKRYPASMGVSVLLPPFPAGGDVARVTVRFAEYVADSFEVEGARRPKKVWRRVPRERVTVEVPINTKALDKGVGVPNADSVYVAGKVETAEAPGLPDGTRALSLFLVNGRSAAAERGRGDEQYIFQIGFELDYGRGLVKRPNRQGEQASDWDDRVSDLQFRDRCEWAVGHGVSVLVPEGQGDAVTRVRTTWLPRYEARRVVTRDEPDVEMRMEQLTELTDPDAVRSKLMPLAVARGRCCQTQLLPLRPRQGRQQLPPPHGG